MYDPTPAPYGTITRRWTGLPADRRAVYVARLLADGGCPVDVAAGHVVRPARDGGVCYRRLVDAAIDGDEVAVGWLATTHRPLLVARGRALFEHDPGEWGAACLEVLGTALAKIDLDAGQWLRRRFAEQLRRRLGSLVDAHLELRRAERPTAPALLPTPPAERVARSRVWDPHPELTAALDRALGDLDAPTRDALWALAHERPLVEVAERYELSYDAVRQRVSRARVRLRPELAGFHRGARR